MPCRAVAWRGATWQGVPRRGMFGDHPVRLRGQGGVACRCKAAWDNKNGPKCLQCKKVISGRFFKYSEGPVHEACSAGQPPQTCIHAHTHTLSHTQTHTHSHTHRHTHTHTRARAHIYSHAHARAHTHPPTTVFLAAAFACHCPRPAVLLCTVGSAGLHWISSLQSTRRRRRISVRATRRWLPGSRCEWKGQHALRGVPQCKRRR